MTGSAIFYGVGVGPGDPKLMTIRAGEVIRTAPVLAYPVNGSGDSHARATAAPVIPEGATELPIHIPMKVDRMPARAAYDDAAKVISGHLGAGRDVAYLCVGDPLFYGSFIYLAARLGDAHPVEVIPGVTGLSACAARTQTPLGHRHDVFSVVPATLDEDALEAALAGADAAAIIKVGRHLEKVRGVLRRLERADDATILESASGSEENVVALEDAPGAEARYFSTILVRGGDVT